MPTAAAALIVLVCTALLAQSYDVGLLGWDTYPIMISSRVQSVGDAVGNFTERLMDGRYAGAFYRPVLNWTFAVDYAVGGLDPTIYQVTNVLTFGLCAAAFYWLVRRAAGAGCVIAPLAALLFFLMHPTHWEVVPAPPRRPEMLCGLFMALALAAQLSPRALTAKRSVILPAMFTLAAVMAKETALVLPALILVALVLYMPGENVKVRTRCVVKAWVPHLVAVGIMLFARLFVLGGLGGHESTDLGAAAQRVPTFAQALLAWLFFPQPVMWNSPAAWWLGVLLGGGLLVTLGLRLGLRPGGNSPMQQQEQCHRWRAGVLAITWLGLISATYAVAGQVQPWYLLLLVMGLALLVGVLADGLVQLIWRPRQPMATRLAAGVSAVLLLGLCGWHARYSPLVYDYRAWDVGTRAAGEFLNELEPRIAEASPGDVVLSPPLPMWVPPAEDRACMRGVAVLNDYSVQAWAEMRFPQAPVRVIRPRSQADLEPVADQIRVVLTRQRTEY